MSWPLFAVIQLVMLTIGVSVAFLLRNRALKKQYEALATGLSAAEEAVARASSRMTDGAERVWLKDRIDSLDAEDEVTQLQRLVLENELEATEDFANRLTEKLSAGAAAQNALRDQWDQARTASQALAVDLISKYPHSHPVITQLHESYNELDATLSTPSPLLPDAPDIPESDQTDLTQEAEHLRATNELLQQELDKSRVELSAHLASGEEAEEQAEDLKNLLKQFTSDSRDMMTCIQKLEVENAELKAQLGGQTNEPAAPGQGAEDAA